MTIDDAFLQFQAIHLCFDLPITPPRREGGTDCWGVTTKALSKTFEFANPTVFCLDQPCIQVLASTFGEHQDKGLTELIGAIQVAFYLFFLAGGIGVLAFESSWLQNIAAYNPLSYSVQALSLTVFYSSPDLLGRDVLVLSLTALAAIGLGIFSLRRGIAN